MQWKISVFIRIFWRIVGERNNIFGNRVFQKFMWSNIIQRSPSDGRFERWVTVCMVWLIENMSCFFLSSSFENGKSVGSQKKQLSQNAIPQKKQPFLSFHVAPLKKHAFWLRFQSVFRFEGLFQKCLWRFTKRRQMNTVAVWTDQICASFTNYFKPVNGVILFYSIYIEI